MNSATDYDVAIVGGGMVGISLALALAEGLGNGGRVLLLESFPLPADSPDFGARYSPSFDARSTALSYGSYLIFRQLGIWDQLAARACPIETIHVSDKGSFGSTLMRAADYDWPALGFVIENAWLGNVLVQCLHRQGRVQVRSPARVVGARPATDGVMLDVGDGEAVSTALLVVADGAESSLRSALGIEVEQRDYGQHALVANVGHALPHAGCAFERFSSEGPLACLPLLSIEPGSSGGSSALVWTLSAQRAQQLVDCSAAEFLQALQQQFGYRLGRMQKVGQRRCYELNMVRAREQVRPRVVVIGNAAHALHPVAGQGFNLALRDVARLADVIHDAAEAGEDFSSLAVLRRYSEGQRQDQERTIAFSDRLPGLFMHRDPALGLLRDIGLFALDLSPQLKREFVRYTAGTAASAEYRDVQP